jgi:cell division protein FtsZ
MALFEVDEAASKIRNEVDENANIIFGSSIDSSLEGIIKVSIVATGINNNYKNEPTKIFNTDENYNEFNNINEDHKSIEEFELEKDLQVIDDIDPELKNNINDQIDLETQINRLKIDQDEQNENNTDLEISKDYLADPQKNNLKSILENKNELTEKKSKNLFSRFSSFFGVDNNQDISSGPGIKIEDKIETIDTDTNKDFEEKLNITEPSKHSESFDLFKEKNDPKDNDLVNLIDLEQENKEIDEKVLEIPAFLRRQAN